MTNIPDPILNTETNTFLPSTPPHRSSTAFLLLMAAGLFMVTGICVLLFIGREKARILGQTLTDLDIQPLLNTEAPITADDMQGKVVVIHFWGYWCSHCQTEHPDFVQVQKQYKDDPKVLFASISCSDRANDAKDSLQFYTKKFLSLKGGSEFPVYYDPVEFSRVQISKLLTSGGFSYPTTLVLDPAGKVVDVWRSVVTEKTLANSIEKAKKSR